MSVSETRNALLSMMSPPLTFGFKKKKKHGLSVTTVEKKEPTTERVFISEFGVCSKATKPNETDKIIPKLPNSFNPESRKHFTPRFVPTAVQSTETLKSADRFVAAQAPETDGEIKQYGLQQPRLATSPGPEFTSETPTMTEKDDVETFRAELHALPDEADSQAYERMPVEAFGLALLKGMDWKEGQVLGKNKNKKAIDAIAFVPRASRLGLGAAPTASKKPVMVLPTEQDGKVRHVRTLDEQLVPFSDSTPMIEKGAKRKIISGEHEGFQCTIIQPPENKEGVAVVQLPNEEHVRVSFQDLGNLDRPRTKKRKASTLRRVQESPDSWLQSGIRVRIVDKRLDNGRFYLKKAVVVDIASPGVANLMLDESGKLKENVMESSLETVVPREEGTSIVIVRGPLKGAKAELLQRTSKAGTVAVQLLSDLSVRQMSFDDIAECA